MQRKLESLPPISYLPPLKIRKTQLEHLIKLKKAAIERSKLPENLGHIRIVPHHKVLQYYLINKKGDSIGKYLSREQNNFAEALVKLDYDRKVLSAMEKEQSFLAKLISYAEKMSCEFVFKRFSKYRKQLVTPVTLPDDDFVRQWESESYDGNNFEIKTEFYTAKGEKVRSKSEVIIADTLSRLKIPYKYEYPLRIEKQNRIIYPDFCCLDVRNRKEIFWEHFGMMDNPEYACKAVAKINSLAQAGIISGQNAIFTFETENCPLNVKQIENMISLVINQRQ